MRQRCENPNNDRFAAYGGRGIRVCERWQTFENFFSDMGARPAGTSIDRYPDKNGNYEPGNCRWASPREQQNNRRVNHLITWQGETLTVTEMARKLGINKGTFLARVRRGWTVERAILQSVQQYS
jgi:hypothetical protein